MIEKIKRRGHNRPFHCVLGLSGGRDSSYLAYLLRKKHGLRCLAAYYRTVFTPEVADRNVRRIVRRLDMPLVEIRNIPWDLHVRVARRFCAIWKKSPLPAIANLCCAPCKLVNRELLRIARSQHVSTLVLAGNRFEEIQFLPTFQEGDLDTEAHSLGRQARKLARVAAKGIRLVARHPAVVVHLPLAVKASLLYLTPFSFYLQLAYPGIYRVDYFFHAPWVESEVVGTIQSELGWELPPGCTDTWKADCDFAEVKSYMFYRMHRATYQDGLLSNLVRAGQLSREEALARLEGQPLLSPVRWARAMNRLGLPVEFFDS